MGFMGNDSTCNFSTHLLLPDTETHGRTAPHIRPIELHNNRDKADHPIHVRSGIRNHYQGIEHLVFCTIGGICAQLNSSFTMRDVEDDEEKDLAHRSSRLSFC